MAAARIPTPGHVALAMPPSGDGDALARLIAGPGRFHHRQFEADHDRYERLLEGQRPEVMVVACSDSRTTPASRPSTSA